MDLPVKPAKPAKQKKRVAIENSVSKQVIQRVMEHTGSFSPLL